MRRPLSFSGLAEQDEDATEVNEAQVVEGGTLIAYHQPAAICSPAEISTLFDEMWEAELPYLEYFD